MSEVANYLFFTGLIMFAIGLILLIVLSSSEHRWWMWFLLIIGFLLMIWGGFLWMFKGAVKGGGSEGIFGELEEAAIFA